MWGSWKNKKIKIKKKRTGGIKDRDRQDNEWGGGV